MLRGAPLAQLEVGCDAIGGVERGEAARLRALGGDGGEPRLVRL